MMMQPADGEQSGNRRIVMVDATIGKDEDVDAFLDCLWRRFNESLGFTVYDTLRYKRALEPLVAILWGLFIAASVWFALVWIGPIDAVTLGFKFEPDAPPPPNAAFMPACTPAKMSVSAGITKPAGVN